MNGYVIGKTNLVNILDFFFQKKKTVLVLNSQKCVNDKTHGLLLMKQANSKLPCSHSVSSLSRTFQTHPLHQNLLPNFHIILMSF